MITNIAKAGCENAAVHKPAAIRKFLSHMIILGFWFVPLLFSPSPMKTVAQFLSPGEKKGVAWLPEQKWLTGPNTYNWAGIENDLQDMNDAGIGWVRVIFNENQSTDYADEIVSRIRAHNIKILVRVMKSFPAKDLGTETQVNNYVDWLSQTVTRYKENIQYWEIHNEENIPPYWNIDHSDGSDPVLYAQSVTNYITLLRKSYETIKAIDPNLQVLIGGLCEYKVERYMDELIKQNAYQYFDIMAYHPYALNPDAVIGRLVALKNKMALQPEMASKPIWITEVGFHTPFSWSAPGLVADEYTKADYLLQTMQRLDDAGVAYPIFWFNFSEVSNVYNGFGLVYVNSQTMQRTYLQAYAEYKSLWDTKFVFIAKPVADSYVSKSASSTNFGNSQQLHIVKSSNGKDLRAAYLKYDLTPLNGKNLLSTYIRIQVANVTGGGSAVTQYVRIVPDTAWQENSLTYKNKPALTALLGTVSGATNPTWYQFPLDINAIQPFLGGIFSIGLETQLSDNLVLTSRESKTPPQLIIYYQ